MKNALLFSVILFALGSCRKDPTILPVIAEPLPEFKTMDLIQFKLEVPQAWTDSVFFGADSYVGRIYFSETEFAIFDLGWYSNPLNVDTTTHIISYTTIDGKSAKIVQAIDSENGTTGVYFPILVSGWIDKFNLWAENISSLNQEKLLIAIETLDFVE
jgi:hypothetical protein